MMAVSVYLASCYSLSGQWFRAYGNENWEFNEVKSWALSVAPPQPDTTAAELAHMF
jgi:nuclear transport factor 2 (NTF2) superfamily protein